MATLRGRFLRAQTLRAIPLANISLFLLCDQHALITGHEKRLAEGWRQHGARSLVLHSTITGAQKNWRFIYWYYNALHHNERFVRQTCCFIRTQEHKLSLFSTSTVACEQAFITRPTWINACSQATSTVSHNTVKLSFVSNSSVPLRHRGETYRAVTDRCKHCGSLRFHVPIFSQAAGQKMIKCACSASFKASRHPIRCMHPVTCRARAQKKVH
jgi:nitrite reductase/ring-hydroxylating ferredoxin subunit